MSVVERVKTAITAAQTHRAEIEQLRTTLAASEVVLRGLVHMASLELAQELGAGNSVIPFPDVANEWRDGDSRARWHATLVRPRDARSNERPVLCMVYVPYIGYADDGVGVGTPARWSPALDRRVAWPYLPDRVDLLGGSATVLHGNSLDTFGRQLEQITERGLRIEGLS